MHVISLPAPLYWGITVLIVVVTGIYAWRQLRWLGQYFQQQAQEEEAQRRHEKLEDHQIASLLREREEQMQDTQPIKTARERLQRARRLRNQGKTWLAAMLLPMALLMLLGMVSLLFPALRATAVFGSQGLAIGAVISILFWVVCLVQSYRCEFQIRRLARRSLIEKPAS